MPHRSTGADSWRQSTSEELRRLADVFLDPVFIAEMSREGDHLHTPLSRAAARATAVHTVDATPTCSEIRACLEALDRSMLELQAATARLEVPEWWTHAELKAAVAAL